MGMGVFFMAMPVAIVGNSFQTTWEELQDKVCLALRVRVRVRVRCCAKFLYRLCPCSGHDERCAQTG